MAKLLIRLIGIYRYCLSPLLGANCRFHPSCSRYFQEALAKHGLLKGAFLGIKRIGRCHPWHEAGMDPVPDAFAFGKTASKSRHGP